MRVEPGSISVSRLFPLSPSGGSRRYNSRMPDTVVRNPYTGEDIQPIPLIDRPALDRAADAAHEAFQTYRHTPAYQRRELLTRIAGLIRQRREDFANTIMLEAGKPIALAEAEVDRACWTFESAAGEARRFHGELIQADAFPSGAGHIAIAKRLARRCRLRHDAVQLPVEPRRPQGCAGGGVREHDRHQAVPCARRYRR